MLFAIFLTIVFAYGIFVLFLPIVIWYQQKKIWKMEEKINRQEKIINLISNDKYKQDDESDEDSSESSDEE